MFDFAVHFFAVIGLLCTLTASAVYLLWLFAKYAMRYRLRQIAVAEAIARANTPSQ